jgi:hypothetical protein
MKEIYATPSSMAQETNLFSYIREIKKKKKEEKEGKMEGK